MRELLQRIDSHELAEWNAYFRLDPFGQDRQDIGAALVACTVANVNRSNDQDPYEIQDFMPRFGVQEEQRQDWKDQLSLVEMMNEAFGGLDLRGER